MSCRGLSSRLIPAVAAAAIGVASPQYGRPSDVAIAATQPGEQPRLIAQTGHGDSILFVAFSLDGLMATNREQ